MRILRSPWSVIVQDSIVNDETWFSQSNISTSEISALDQLLICGRLEFWKYTHFSESSTPLCRWELITYKVMKTTLSTTPYPETNCNKPLATFTRPTISPIPFVLRPFREFVIVTLLNRLPKAANLCKASSCLRFAIILPIYPPKLHLKSPPTCINII